jgi:serine phosphatase RsbU (regulator of sigma subunit)
VLAAPVAGAADAWIMWFRPETAETVRWAGRPSKEADVATGRLEPRSSFAAYVEEVRGRSVPWTDAEVDVARDLTRRIAESDSLRARREADMAARLQRALMLEAFPRGRGMRGAAHYQPVSNSPLGGDWYDVFYLPDGRSIVAVGDVAGHGFEVAAAMAQLRHALRAFLVRVPSFEQALERLDEVITTLLPAEMATVVLAEIDAETRSVRLANAGHLPVVVASPDGARLVEVPGPSLGWDSDKPHPAVPVPLQPGERLVMATDGLIERRSRTIDLGLEALRVAAAESAHLGVDEQAARLVETLTDGTDVDDDVTVVVVELDAG